MRQNPAPEPRHRTEEVTPNRPCKSALFTHLLRLAQEVDRANSLQIATFARRPPGFHHEVIGRAWPTTGRDRGNPERPLATRVAHQPSCQRRLSVSRHGIEGEIGGARDARTRDIGRGASSLELWALGPDTPALDARSPLEDSVPAADRLEASIEQQREEPGVELLCHLPDLFEDLRATCLMRASDRVQRLAD